MKGKQCFFVVGILFLLLACSIASSSSTPSEIEPTTTPTLPSGGGIPPTQPSASKCDGFSGTLEMQVMVGPAEAVGLEPVAVGDIPFSVRDGIVQGSGAITYEDILTEDWGTYTVYFDMESKVYGECSGEAGSEILDVNITASGEQMVEVRAEGFSGDYPWEGTHEMDMVFPVEEGATASGEGWAFILHISP